MTIWYAAPAAFVGEGLLATAGSAGVAGVTEYVGTQGGLYVLGRANGFKAIPPTIEGAALAFAGGAVAGGIINIGGKFFRKVVKKVPVDEFVRNPGFKLPGGTPNGNFSNSNKLLSEILETANSKEFIKRAKELGFSEEMIRKLPDRLRQYGHKIGEIPSGGFANDSMLLIGKRSLLSTRKQRIMHELGQCVG